MNMGIDGILSNPYNIHYGKTNAQKQDESTDTITAEERIKQANEFWMQHDALYAEQMATVINTITDAMRTAQEIARRMSSGAKVSPADEQNLQLYDPRMYAAAKQAQMMAQKKKDMSDEILIDQFVERHANDRKDWTSELNEKIQSMANVEVISDTDVVRNNTSVQNSTVNIQGETTVSIDITI